MRKKNALLRVIALAAAVLFTSGSMAFGAAAPAGEALAQASEACDSLLPVGAALQAPRATPAAAGGESFGGTFYVCLSSPFLCGECPDGTHCATEACGSISDPACTFSTVCVSSCIVTNSTGIAQSCR